MSYAPIDNNLNVRPTSSTNRVNTQKRVKKRTDDLLDSLRRKSKLLQDTKKLSRRVNDAAHTQFSIYKIITRIGGATDAINRGEIQINRTRERSIKNIDARSVKSMAENIGRALVIRTTSIAGAGLGIAGASTRLIPPPAAGAKSILARIQGGIATNAGGIGKGLEGAGKIVSGTGPIINIPLESDVQKNRTKTEEEFQLWSAKNQASEHFGAQKQGSMDDLRKVVDANQRLFARN